MALPLYVRDPVKRARLEQKIAERERQFAEKSEARANLPLMQKIALLKMAPSTLARGVARAMISADAFGEYPTYNDYRALANLDLADKPEGSQWHQITALGEAQVFSIVRAECRRLGIHVMQYGSLLTTSAGGNASIGCSCGGWRWHGRAGTYTEANARRGFAQHIASVKGMDKLTAALEPPQMAEG